MDSVQDKHEIIRDLFVRSADENYIAARWCVMNELFVDFYWLSVHSLEKYLKAVLLMNGRPAKKYGHDVVWLFRDVKNLAGALIPLEITQPKNLITHSWWDKTAEEFVERLLKWGNADNRYRVYGYVMRTQDIHMLDQLVFSIRRLICPLDEREIPNWLPGSTPMTNRDVLTIHPTFFARLFMPLDSLIFTEDPSEKRFAALNLNTAFAPENFKHTFILEGSASVRSVLETVFDHLSHDSVDRVKTGIELAGWVLENIKLPGGSKAEMDVVGEIKAAVQIAQKRHRL